MNIVSYIVGFIVIVLVVIGVTIAIESALARHNGVKRSKLSTHVIAMIGLFAAIGTVISLFEIPLPFAPSFYKLDFSALPVLIISFAYGPMAGVLCELVKLLLKLLFKGTTSAFVGVIANFVIESAFLLPAGAIYAWKKSKGRAVLGCVVGTVCMTVVGALLNAYFLLPTYAILYGMDISKLVAMGTKVNANINSVFTLVLLAVVPFNLLKGVAVSVLTTLLYKHISKLIKKRS